MFTSSVGSVQRKFEAINKETRQLIDTALKNKGVATIAELMQKVVNDIQDSDQKKAVQSVRACCALFFFASLLTPRLARP